MRVYCRCEDCNCEGFTNPKTEQILDEIEVETPTMVFDNDKKEMKKVMQKAKVNRPRMAKYKTLDLNTNMMVEKESAELKDLETRIIPVKLQVGFGKVIQVGFCSKCYGGKHKERVIEFFDWLATFKEA